MTLQGKREGPVMRLHLAILALVIMSGGAYAGTAISGAGAASCASFGKFYQDNPRDAEEAFFTWAQGYMSGINTTLIVLSRGSRDLSGMPQAHQQSFLRQYCNGHPLENYADAVNELYGKLPWSIEPVHKDER
jgi:hypothetical protein